MRSGYIIGLALFMGLFSFGAVVGLLHRQFDFETSIEAELHELRTDIWCLRHQSEADFC